MLVKKCFLFVFCLPLEPINYDTMHKYLANCILTNYSILILFIVAWTHAYTTERNGVNNVKLRQKNKTTWGTSKESMQTEWTVINRPTESSSAVNLKKNTVKKKTVSWYCTAE